MEQSQFKAFQAAHEAWKVAEKAYAAQPTRDSHELAVRAWLVKERTWRAYKGISMPVAGAGGTVWNPPQEAHHD